MTAKILMFPASRIAEASAEIFAKRTQPEWQTQESADEILRSMAGMPRPRLGTVRIIDCEHVDKFNSLMDLINDLNEMIVKNAQDQQALVSRFLDLAEKMK